MVWVDVVRPWGLSWFDSLVEGFFVDANVYAGAGCSGRDSVDVRVVVAAGRV